MAGNAGITVQQIINEALSILGVYSNDPLDASDLQSAFFTLQAMLDGWGAEQLTFRQTSLQTFSTTAGKQSYVIGPAQTPTPDWVTPFLPLEFPEGSVQMVLPGSPALEIPLAIDTAFQWSAIAIKGMQSGILNEVWPQMGITSHSLNFWPVPNASLAINLYLPQQLAIPTATTATFSGPPGYQEAITYELAIKCSSKFGAALPAWLPVAWQEAKAKIKAVNFPMLDQYCDQALLPRGSQVGGGSIKFYTGE